jgi:hypothetical protein
MSRETDYVRRIEDKAEQRGETLYPVWTTWTPTFTGYIVGGAPSGGIYRYSLVGKICYFSIREPNAGTSGGAVITISAPFTAATITGMQWIFAAGLVDNNVTLTTWGRGRIGSGESVFTFGANPAIDGGFTSSGNKRVSTFSGFYEIT